VEVAPTPGSRCCLLLGEFALQTAQPPTARLGDRRRAGGEGMVID
jgi:hypothetical protein